MCGRKKTGVHITYACALGLVLAFTSPGLSQTLDTPECKQDLAEIRTRMESAVTQLKGVARANRDDKCAAYLHHSETVLKAREVLGRCKAGREREGDLAHMDNALDDIKATIRRECAAR